MENINTEIWKDVVGYEGKYQVSNIGNVQSLKSRWGERSIPHVMVPQLSGAGTEQIKYLRVLLTKNGQSKKILVHRLVASAFVTNHDNKPHVNHIDGNRLNNRIENLEWCTHRENMSHARNRPGLTGTKFMGPPRKGKKRWAARIKIKSKQYHLGYFTTQHEAHLAYMTALIRFNEVNKYA